MALLKRWGLEPRAADREGHPHGDGRRPAPLADRAGEAGPHAAAAAGQPAPLRAPDGRPASPRRSPAGRPERREVEQRRRPAGRRPRGLLLALVRISSYANAPDAMDAGAALAQLRRGLKGVRYVDGGWQRLVTGWPAPAGRRRTAAYRSAVAAVESDGVRPPGGHLTAVEARLILAGLAPAEVLRLLGEPRAGSATWGRPSRRVPGARGAPARAEPLVLGLDQPLYLSVHAPVARWPRRGAMVEVMKYLPPGRAVGRRGRPGRTGRAPPARRHRDDHIAERRFLRRMTVAHAMPLARHGGLAGRPTVTTPLGPTSSSPATG